MLVILMDHWHNLLVWPRTEWESVILGVKMVAVSTKH